MLTAYQGAWDHPVRTHAAAKNHGTLFGSDLKVRNTTVPARKVEPCRHKENNSGGRIRNMRRTTTLRTQLGKAWRFLRQHEACKFRVGIPRVT